MHASFKEEVTSIQRSVLGWGSSRGLLKARSYLQNPGKMRAKRGAMKWRWSSRKLDERTVLHDGDHAGCVRGYWAGGHITRVKRNYMRFR